MRKVYILCLLACILFTSSFGQSVLNPNDPIVNYDSNNPPAQPTYGQIGKWVRTPRLSWNTSEYKCYIYKGSAFRLHFPKTYNPTANDGKKYPMLVFFHGIGEAGTIYDNEYQLYHGGDVFQKAVDNGTFDGYILFMQSPAPGFWSSGQYQLIVEIINYMIANNKLDPFAVSYNGLSGGGDGTWGMMHEHPEYTASGIPMSAASFNFTTQDWINKLKFLPLWNVQGGQDAAPTAYTARQIRDTYLAAGANYSYTEFTTLGHNTWDSTWKLTDFWPFLLRAYSANPWTLFGRTQFCPGDNINVTIGVTPAYQAYQWKRNDDIIPNATSNSIQVTQTGTYYARVERNGIWSDWSRTPVNITVQASTPTPPIETVGLMSQVIPGADGKNYVDLEVSGNGTYTGYVWKKVGSNNVLSTDATYEATQPGYYVVAANQPFSCSSDFSQAFKVIDAKGPNAPTAVKSLIANALSNTQVQLGWSSPAQQSNSPTAFEIYRGTSSGTYSFVGQVSPSINSYIDSNLSPKTKYFYAIRAVDSTGAAPLSNEASTTTSSDTSAPSNPGNLRSTFTTPSTISIAWDASSDNVGVDHYNIYVNGSLSNVTQQTSFVLSGLVQSQPYAIYVTAVDGSSNASGASNQITAEPILGGLKYSYYTTSAAWSVLPNFSTLTPVKTGISSNTDITVATQSSNYGFLWQGYIQVPVNGTYTFATTSDDGSALWFNSYTPTGTPTVNNDGLHGSTTKAGSAITLTAGIYPICIEFFQAGGGANMSVSWASVALFGNTTQHTIDNKYFVGTYVNAGSVPAVPNTVTATALSFDKIKISWHDNSNNETGFEVYRSTSANGTYNIAGTVGANTTTYNDSALSPSTTYYYKVQAVNQYGNSGLSKQDTTASSTNGLNYYFYKGTWSVLPDFTTLTPSKTGFSTTTDLSVATQSTNYGFVWHGYLKITKAGSYSFGTTSDDGSALWFNSNTASGTPTVNNDGLHGSTTKTSSSISIAIGTYPITVEFFQQGGGANMSITYQVPGTSSYVTIPASALFRASIGAIPSATTLALPAPPATPGNFKATATSASQISLTWNSVSGATGYQLSRSIGGNSNYIALATVASNITSYSDTGLNANLIHYYKIVTTGVGGTTSSASTASATTQNNAPVITKLNAISVPFGSTTTINVSATDADGDVLSYTGSLPPFASLVSNGNGESLVLNPAQSDMGVYSNQQIVVNDSHGGTDNTTFTLTVNNNYLPAIDAIGNYTMNENDVVNIPLTAHDQNAGDVLTWSVSNAPNAYTLINNSNGSATLTLHPNFLSAGTYNPVVTVNDGNGGITTATFTVVVNDKSPNTNIYVRFKYNTPIGSPWNSVTGLTTNNLVDENGNTTNVGLALQTSWWANYNSGVTTGNNSGVYPDAVLEDYYYFGIFGGPETVDTKITGLDPSKKYNLTFFGASNFSLVPDNGSTVYTVGSQSDTLRVQNNMQNTVSINGITPAADGTITYTMSKGLNTPVGYINALIITSVFDDGNAPAVPTNLTAQDASGGGVQLSWKDVAFNEDGYYIYRALTSNQVYAQVGQTAINATSYVDSTANGNVQYSYKIAAFNSHGTSAYSNVATLTTEDRVPKLNPISDIILKSNQTATVNITANDDASDHVTLTVSGLPSFATFTDNGNGTGKINITPDANSVGGFYVTITATDNSNVSSSTAFNILVSDPNISSTYISFSDGQHSVPKPWNLIAPYPFTGLSVSNLVDDSNIPTGITLTIKNGFTNGVVESGMQPVEGVGIYPNVVMRTAFYDANGTKDTIMLTGLSTSKKYNFVFFNSHNDGKNCTTNFIIGSQTVTLNASGNLGKTVQINGISPDASGRVYVVVQKASGADYAFISTLIIQSYAPSYTTLAPTSLRTTAITRNSIGLQWQDRASNETGYQIWRAADGAGSYTLLTTVGANTTSYTNTNLNTNTTYNYVVRAVFSGPVYSSFSNPVKASTYGYNVYINFTSNSNYWPGVSTEAKQPWNNLNAPPQVGNSFNNFLDETGMITSTGLYETSDFSDISYYGINTGNNSGLFPDAVNIENYTEYPGETATFQITGLNIGMKYDFTFFASDQTWSDFNTAYTINGITTILDASLNTNITQTIYGVTPDSYGNVTITVTSASPLTVRAFLAAMIIGGYTPSTSAVVPTLPAGSQFAQSGIIAQTVASGDNATAKTNDALGEIKVFPNPFHNYFSLNVSSQNNSKLQVMMYDAAGKVVYNNTFGSMHQGVNSLKVVTNSNLTAGVYTVVVINMDTKAMKTIKIIKQ